MESSFVTSINFSNINNDIIYFNLLFSDFIFDNKYQYKILINKIKKIKLIDTIKLSSINSLNNKVLLKNLKSGTYKLIYKNGIIYNLNSKCINKDIKSSSGDVKTSLFNINKNIDDVTLINHINNNNYNDFNLSQYQDFEFKIHKGEIFSLYIDENCIGNIEFYLVKNATKIKNDEDEVFLINNENKSSIYFYLEKNTNYIFEIYKNVSAINLNPKFKYPDGTYELSINDTISTSKNGETLINNAKNDKQKFSILNNKLINLNNVVIPNSVNPINYYLMIGKYEAIIYLDLILDECYIYPCSPIECFMSLYIPDNKFEKIDSNKNFIIYKITIFKYISNDCLNKRNIINALKTWLNVNESDINEDEYELFYWVNINLFNKNFIFNEMNDIINKNIEPYYYYVSLDLTYNAIYNIDTNTLSIKLKNCVFNILEEPNDCITIWNQQSDWSSTEKLNNVISYINGNAIIKITKERFKYITNMNLDQIATGFLTNENVKELNIKEPEFKSLNTFKYILRNKEI